MTSSNVFQEGITDSWPVAVLLSTDGYALSKCTTGGNGCTYTFAKVPAEDLKIYEAEAANPDTLVKLSNVLGAVKTLQQAEREAGRNLGYFSCHWFRHKEE